MFSKYDGWLSTIKGAGMTPEEFEAKMKAIFDKEAEGACREDMHYEADELMYNLLIDLGYTKGVEWFKKLPKWYA